MMSSEYSNSPRSLNPTLDSSSLNRERSNSLDSLDTQLDSHRVHYSPDSEYNKSPDTVSEDRYNRSNERGDFLAEWLASDQELSAVNIQSLETQQFDIMNYQDMNFPDIIIKAIIDLGFTKTKIVNTKSNIRYKQIEYIKLLNNKIPEQNRSEDQKQIINAISKNKSELQLKTEIESTSNTVKKITSKYYKPFKPIIKQIQKNSINQWLGAIFDSSIEAISLLAESVDPKSFSVFNNTNNLYKIKLIEGIVTETDDSRLLKRFHYYNLYNDYINIIDIITTDKSQTDFESFLTDNREGNEDDIYSKTYIENLNNEISRVKIEIEKLSTSLDSLNRHTENEQTELRLLSEYNSSTDWFILPEEHSLIPSNPDYLNYYADFCKYNKYLELLDNLKNEISPTMSEGYKLTALSDVAALNATGQLMEDYGGGSKKKKYTKKYKKQQKTKKQNKKQNKNKKQKTKNKKQKQKQKI